MGMMSHACITNIYAIKETSSPMTVRLNDKLLVRKMNKYQVANASISVSTKSKPSFSNIRKMPAGHTWMAMMKAQELGQLHY